MKETLEFKTRGNCLIPDIKLQHDGITLIGKYERLRREFLKNFAPISYNDLVLSEQLFPHLKEIEETATKRMEILISQLLDKKTAPNKKENQMAWVKHMNMLKTQAEEIVLNELIYN